MAIIYAKLVEEDIELGVGTISVPLPGGATATGTMVNLSTLAAINTFMFFGDSGPASVGSLQSVSVSVSVPGASEGDPVFCWPTVPLQGLFVTAYSGVDVVVLNFFNPTNATVIPPPVKQVGHPSPGIGILVFKIDNTFQ
jgi:hypothetical protein